MRKSLVIAAREYVAAVKTKSFVIGIILTPLFMFGSVWVQSQARKVVDTQPQKVVIVDHTPNAALAGALVKANEVRTQTQLADETGRAIAPRFDLEIVAPIADTDAQRLALADRVRAGELLAYVEIGADLVKPVDSTATASDSTPSVSESTHEASASTSATEAAAAKIDARLIRYSTGRPTYMTFREWMRQAIYLPLLNERSRIYNLPGETVRDLAVTPTVIESPMPVRDATGSAVYPTNAPTSVTSILIPSVLCILMMLPVLIGASPLAMNVIEEKQLRIAEVLLGGVRPFDLMLGKLIGGAGVSMTLALIYLAGSLYVAAQLDAAKYLNAQMLGTFVIFTMIAVFLYGAIFVAAGAAVTNIKESQAVVSPLIILLVIPVMLMPMVVQQPDGMLARFLSFFPLTAPMTIVALTGVPPAPAWWYILLSGGVSVASALVIVWAAGRIFRVGILSNSKPASVGEAVRWMVKG
jgi:ABC-2 type transport system permease protein